MKRTLIRLLTITCLLAAGSLNSVAQEKEQRRDEAKVPTDGTFKILAPMPPKKIAIAKVVKGAPYSATAITETIQTLSDGNQIIRKNESKLYRDSEGRTRIEQSLETIGKWAVDGEAQQRIFINDPVAGESYSLDPRTRAAHKTIYPQKKPATGAQREILMINGQKVITYTIDGKTVTQAEFEAFAEAAGKKKRAQAEILDKEIKEASNNPPLKKKLEMVKAGNPGAGQRKSEALGTQTIEGLTVEGTRATLTIPAGEIGNTLPIEIVDETWYSAELRINVMTKHRDPRSGEATYRLTNISRSEPDRSLFEVPPDYTVREGKMPIKRRPAKEEE